MNSSNHEPIQSPDHLLPQKASKNSTARRMLQVPSSSLPALLKKATLQEVKDARELMKEYLAKDIKKYGHMPLSWAHEDSRRDLGASMELVNDQIFQMQDFCEVDPLV